MIKKQDRHALLGISAVMLCTVALWLILGAGAELARLTSGVAVAIAAGCWARLADH